MKFFDLNKSYDYSILSIFCGKIKNIEYDIIFNCKDVDVLSLLFDEILDEIKEEIIVGLNNDKIL